MNNDLIRRRDVEKMLVNLGGFDPVDVYSKGWYDAIDEALRKLVKIESADRWIPCSERLPNFYESVLVTAKTEEDNISLVYQGARCRDGFELSGVANPTDYKVLAWQYQPEPWEGEEK